MSTKTRQTRTALKIESHILLAPLTTFRIGGHASYFCAVSTVDELREAVAFTREKKVPFFVLGEGSNLLVSDKGYAGLVIRMNIRGIKIKDVEGGPANVVRKELEVGAGENWDSLVAFAVSQKLYGLENLSLIPGTVGAAPVQNIGAYGAEAKDVISTVEVFDIAANGGKGALRVLTNEECKFAYRDSIFKHGGPHGGAHLIITKVSFVLEKNGRVNIGYKDVKEVFKDRYSSDVTAEEVRRAVIDIRTRKLPDVKKIGTAGSFFKNPILSAEQFEEFEARFPDAPHFSESAGADGKPRVKVPLAWVLDKACGLKGWQEGAIGTYDKQPLALVNHGGGTAAEVEKVAEHIARVVKEKTGIDIEWEVRVLK